MRAQAAKELKRYAIYECLAQGMGMVSWKFYKHLKRAYREKRIFLKSNGVPTWHSTQKPVVPKLLTRGVVTLG